MPLLPCVKRKTAGSSWTRSGCRTGLEVHIISNSEQRFISYKAVASKGGEFNQIIQKGTAIVDVGFGSAQISLFDKDSLVATQNLPLGSPAVCAAS